MIFEMDMIGTALRLLKPVEHGCGDSRQADLQETFRRFWPIAELKRTANRGEVQLGVLHFAANTNRHGRSLVARKTLIALKRGDDAAQLNAVGEPNSKKNSDK